MRSLTNYACELLIRREARASRITAISPNGRRVIDDDFRTAMPFIVAGLLTDAPRFQALEMI